MLSFLFMVSFPPTLLKKVWTVVVIEIQTPLCFLKTEIIAWAKKQGLAENVNATLCRYVGAL